MSDTLTPGPVLNADVAKALGWEVANCGDPLAPKGSGITKFYGRPYKQSRDGAIPRFSETVDAAISALESAIQHEPCDSYIVVRNSNPTLYTVGLYAGEDVMWSQEQHENLPLAVCTAILTARAAQNGADRAEISAGTLKESGAMTFNEYQIAAERTAGVQISNKTQSLRRSFFTGTT